MYCAILRIECHFDREKNERRASLPLAGNRITVEDFEIEIEAEIESENELLV